MQKEIPVILKPEWRKSPSTQYYMQILYLGIVAVCKYKKFFPDGDTVSFIATCSMPSIETDLGIFKTEEDARKWLSEQTPA